MGKPYDDHDECASIPLYSRLMAQVSGLSVITSRTFWSTCAADQVCGVPKSKTPSMRRHITDSGEDSALSQPRDLSRIRRIVASQYQV